MDYKTPGVYIVEKNAFPNSVVEVDTAIPAFIGYTAKADNKGSPLTGKPWRITSISEFINYYGTFPEFEFTIQVQDASDLNAVPDFEFKANKYSLAQSAGRFLLYQSMVLFFQNGGAVCYVVSVGGFNAAISAQDLIAGIDALKKEPSPAMVVVPDAVSLSAPECSRVQQAVLAHCGMDMKSRFAILDIHDGFKKRTDPSGDCVARFRDALGVNGLDFAAAYYPWVNTTVVQDSDLDFTLIADAASQKILKDLLTVDMGVAGTAPADATALKNWTDKIDAINAIGQTVPGAAMSDEQLAMAFADRSAAVNKLLIQFSPLYVSVMGIIRNKLNVLPPGAAMAGIYTKVDQTRGVWKAPANISLSAVETPVVDISQEEQEDLNVCTVGKSINAIRSFVGQGTLVWGARTLDGNSLDWRYISVRRSTIMLEQSLRLAARAYVFEPNVANTWITVKSMARNFLTSIWKRGGLVGATPDEAFSVFVGLGETMTQEDILEGFMKVTVLVALSRPTEFIEITFQQQMQKS
ncbi:phage tail sheath protein FI [Oxalobacteraceae bacterium GrIS 2.11]